LCIICKSRRTFAGISDESSGRKIIMFLNPLEIQNDHSARLKHLGNQLYFHFDRKVSNPIPDFQEIFWIKTCHTDIDVGVNKKK